jgi:hypothetical protein
MHQVVLSQLLREFCLGTSMVGHLLQKHRQPSSRGSGLVLLLLELLHQVWRLLPCHLGLFDLVQLGVLQPGTWGAS